MLTDETTRESIISWNQGEILQTTSVLKQAEVRQDIYKNKFSPHEQNEGKVTPDEIKAQSSKRMT